MEHFYNVDAGNMELESRRERSSFESEFEREDERVPTLREIQSI